MLKIGVIQFIKQSKLRTYQKYIDNPHLIELHKAGDFFKKVFEDIKKNGIVNPLVVAPEQDFFRLKLGNNRFLAAEELGIDPLPCIIGNYDRFELRELKKQVYTKTIGDNW